MTQVRAFSDEELTAFLDGEADADLVRQIESALETDADLSDRIAALDISGLDIRSAFDVMLQSAPPMPDLPPVAAEQPSASSVRGFWPGMGVGIAAGLLMAFAFSLAQPNTDKEPGWLAVVANYQMLYTPETVALRPAGPNDGPGAPRGAYAATLEELSQVVGLDLTGLKNIDGLQFRRAQQLGWQGKPLIQIAYALPDGTPVAICILPSDSAARGPRAQVLEGMAATDWTTGTHGVLVIGGDNQNDIDAVIPQVQASI